ncbi:MAG: alkaline phosphatase family protein [bacterium]
MHMVLSLLMVFGLILSMPVLAADNPGNVILMGWDGAHRDHVKALLKDDKLPNLKKLIAEGTFVDIDVTSGATDTKAGWTQILTGYKPEVTGVYNNGKYQDVPAGYSVFERLKERFGTNTFAAVAVIGKKSHCGEINEPFKRPCEPATDGAEEATAKKDEKDKVAGAIVEEKTGKVDAKDNVAGKGGKKAGNKKGVGRKMAAKNAGLGRIVEENGQKFMVFGGSPYYTMHKACDEWHIGLEKDGKVGDKAIELLDKYKEKQFFFFVHFAEVDHVGHKSGEPSKEYNDAIISGDTQLGRLVEKLQALKLYDKTKIYVTADHGFDIGAKGHSYAPYVFLGTNDKKVARDGTRADIAPTVLDNFGLDLAKFMPALDGESLRQAAVKPVEKAPATRPGAADAKKRSKKE